MRMAPSLSEPHGWDVDTYEKTTRLLDLLADIAQHPELGRWLCLKGGTALNLFVLPVARLSVDIDLNFIGTPDREGMLASRPVVEAALARLCTEHSYKVILPLDRWAGGKWNLRYDNVQGERRRISIDVGYLDRVPLWDFQLRTCRLPGYERLTVNVLDVHELAGGKLAALQGRGRARDLFDAASIADLCRHGILNPSRLRLAFAVQAAMTRTDARTLAPVPVKVDAQEILDDLNAMLPGRPLTHIAAAHTLGEELTAASTLALAAVLPLRDRERAFLDRFFDQGDIEPALLTDDIGLQNRLALNPALQWQAYNVRRNQA